MTSPLVRLCPSSSLGLAIPGGGSLPRALDPLTSPPTKGKTLFADLRALINERDSLTTAYASGYVSKDVYDREVSALDLTISTIYRKA